jgi:hypothetical protein
MSVHDFARFVKQYPLVPEPRRDLFGETEAEIRADEDVWEHQFAESRDALRTMAREAATEYLAGRGNVIVATYSTQTSRWGNK